MKKVLFLLCVLTISINTAFAFQMGGFDAGTMNQQYVRDMRTHEFATRAKSKNAIVNTADKTNRATADLDKATQQLPENSNIKSITFINNHSIPTSELERVVSYGINKPATANNIAQIRQTLTKFYQANGFYSALIFPNIQNLSTGELIIEVKEGIKNSITVE